jgi:hypothetical protein
MALNGKRSKNRGVKISFFSLLTEVPEGKMG